MEYLEGQPLNALMKETFKRNQWVPPTLWARVCADALAGLHYAHELKDYDGTPLNIVHRDVSPQNIFVTYEGRIVVVDFGIAKADLRNTKTEIGVFKGKASYMAPEQIESDKVDRRCDCFSTGVVLWELLVGKRLMAAGSTPQTLFKLLNAPIPRVSDELPDVDPSLDDIVARALERDPKKRFQTAHEMRQALEDYLSTARPAVRSEDVANLTVELFRDVRERVDRRVQESVASMAQSLSSGSIMAAPPNEGSRSAMRLRETLSESSALARSSTLAPPLLPSFAADTERPRRLRLAAALGALAVVLGVAAVVKGTASSTPLGMARAYGALALELPPATASAKAEPPPSADPTQPPRPVEAPRAYAPAPRHASPPRAAAPKETAAPNKEAKEPPPAPPPPSTAAAAPPPPPSTAPPAEPTVKKRRYRSDL
jgi:serine/threonine-protein kinase